MKGWKTLGFAILVAVLGALDSFVWSSVIPDAVEPFVLPMIAVVIAYLRSVTDTAIGKSE